MLNSFPKDSRPQGNRRGEIDAIMFWRLAEIEENAMLREDIDQQRC